MKISQNLDLRFRFQKNTTDQCCLSKQPILTKSFNLPIL